MGYLFYLLKKILKSDFCRVLFWYSVGVSVIFLISSTDSIFSDIVLVILICFALVSTVFGVVTFIKELYPEIKEAFKKSYEKYLQQKKGE